MTSEQYKKISEPFRSESMTKLLKLTNKGLTIFGFAAYPVLLISLFILAPEKLLTAIVVPGSGFVLLTLVRRKINRTNNCIKKHAIKSIKYRRILC